MVVAVHDADKEHMKNKNFPNYALMKISAFHKQKGDTVVWFNPLERNEYDIVYSSKVFSWTPENPYLPDNTIKGGTGYDVYSTLPKEIDDMYLDYSIYPDCDYAIGFLTRGCIYNCDFCVVPKKEGGIKPYRTWQEVVRPDSKKLLLMDNNILACQYGIEQLRQLAETDYLIDCNQGMSIRLITEDICKIIKQIKWMKYIRFSCDGEYQLPYFEKAIEMFDRYQIPKSKVFIYTLIRDDLKEADRRIQKLHKMCRSFNIYAQAERQKDKQPTKLQLEFAQRYVYGRLYKRETWVEYTVRKGFNNQ